MIEKEILVGNLIAIVTGILQAIFIAYSKPITTIQNCPISVYLILLSASIVVISFFFAFLNGDHIEIFSTESEYGVLAFIADWDSFLYGLVGLGVMAGFAYHYFTLMAQSYIGTTFISISYTLVPVAAQVTAYLINVEPVLPGSLTAIGGISLIFGCSLLALNYSDHQYLSHLPLVIKRQFNENRFTINE